MDRQVGFWSQRFFADQTMTNLHMWTFTCKVCKLGHFLKATHHSTERQHNFSVVFRSILNGHSFNATKPKTCVADCCMSTCFFLEVTLM